MRLKLLGESKFDQYFTPDDICINHQLETFEVELIYKLISFIERH